jgi:hypothetical protein
MCDLQARKYTGFGLRASGLGLRASGWRLPAHGDFLLARVAVARLPDVFGVIGDRVSIQACHALRAVRSRLSAPRYEARIHYIVLLLCMFSGFGRFGR